MRISRHYWKVDRSSPGSQSGVGLGEEKGKYQGSSQKKTFMARACMGLEVQQVNSAGRVLAICEEEQGAQAAEGMRS